MAVKKKRSVEELEQLLEASERIRKEHLAFRKDQLVLLRLERANRFNQFVQMTTPFELHRLTKRTILSDQKLVDQAVLSVIEMRKNDHSRVRRGNTNGVFSQRPDASDAIDYEFRHVFQNITHYEHTHRQLVDTFIVPLLRRKETVDAIGVEDIARVNRVYLRYSRVEETYDLDIQRVRELLQGSIESLVVKQRAIDSQTNVNINYKLGCCVSHIEAAQKNLLQIMSESSIAKSEQITSFKSKINW